MRTHLLNIVIIASMPVFSFGCSERVSFNDDVKPILTASCLQCHNGKGEGSKKSGFNVQDYNSIMKGTKFGPVVVAGESASSTLYRLIDHKADPKIQMPPHHDVTFAEGKTAPLEKEQIETIKKWIDQGAENN